MPPATVTRLLAGLRERVAGAAPGQEGTLWRLDEPGRQLDADLVRLAPGAVVEEHQEDADVLLLTVAGSGSVTAGAESTPLAADATAWLPRRVRRGFRAGPDGLAYVAVRVRQTAPAAGREEGGEAACWLSQVCPECGKIPDGVRPAFCSRCGEPLTGN